MESVVIENPILNSPYDEPTRHFRFSDEGITDEVVIGRRISSYFVPIARPRKRDKLVNVRASFSETATPEVRHSARGPRLRRRWDHT